MEKIYIIKLPFNPLSEIEYDFFHIQHKVIKEEIVYNQLIITYLNG